MMRKAYLGSGIALLALYAILAFSGMGLALGDALIEAEINPLFVLPKGQGVVAADGLAVGSDSV